MLAILDYIKLAFDALLNMIKSMLQGVAMLASGLAFNNSFVLFMPTFLASAFFVFMGIWVVKFLIGRM